MTNLVQDHIHLGADIGVAPENAPEYTWQARNREVVVEYTADVIETLGGRRFAHVIRDSTAAPVIHVDYIYEIKLTERDGQDASYYLQRLLGLAGRSLLLVDHFHVADGEDHTGNIIPVFLKSVGSVPPEEPGLNFFYVKIYLADMRVPA